MAKRLPYVEMPEGQLKGYLAQYRAEYHADVSTNKAHVYFSRPINQWLAVVRKGGNVRVSFSQDCPCSKVLNGLTPWSK